MYNKYFHVLLDVSPSMKDRDGCGEPKIVKAKDIIEDYATRWKNEYPNPDDIFGISVFCGSYRLLGTAKQGDERSFQSLLSRVRNATICSATALYDGILKSLKDMVGVLAKDNSLKAGLIAITDGMDNASCNTINNIDRRMKELKDKYSIKLFVIGLGVEGARQLRELSKVADLCVPVYNTEALYEALMKCCSCLC